MRFNMVLMVEISDRFKALFTAEVIEQDGSYYIEIPEREIELENVSVDDVYQAAILETASQDHSESRKTDTKYGDAVSSDGETYADGAEPEPPVDVGDELQVEIESTGDEGDGVAKVDRGFVVMVEDAEVGDRPTVEITNVSESVAFAEVVEYNSPPPT